MNASNDLAVQAAGYIWAASGSLAIAEQLLPDDHPEAEKLAKLLTQVAKMYERLADAR